MTQAALLIGLGPRVGVAIRGHAKLMPGTNPHTFPSQPRIFIHSIMAQRPSTPVDFEVNNCILGKKRHMHNCMQECIDNSGYSTRY